MQTIAIHPVPAMPAPLPEDIASDDPLADLERAVGRTPTGPAIAPEDLARFHDAARGRAEHPEFPAFVQCLKALPQGGKARVLSDFSYLP